MTRIAVCGGPYPIRTRSARAARRPRSAAASGSSASATSAATAPSCDAIWPLLRRARGRVHRGQLRRRHRPRGHRLRLRLLRPARQRVRAADLRLHARRDESRLRRLDGRAADRAPRADRRRRRAHGARLDARDQRLLWESLSDEQHGARTRASGADVRALHPLRPAVAEAGRRHPRGQRRRVGRPANDGRPDIWYALLDLDDGERAAPSSCRWPTTGRRRPRRCARRGCPRRSPRRRDRLVDHLPGDRAAVRASRGRYQLYRPLPGFESSRSPGPTRPRSSTTGCRWSRCSAARCSRRGCGSTRTSTATSPAPTARSRRRRGAAARARARALQALVDEAVMRGLRRALRNRRRAVPGARHRRHARVRDRAPPTSPSPTGCSYHGRRRDELQRLAGRESARAPDVDRRGAAGAHDRYRGPGAWQNADGRAALGSELGLRCASA